MTIIHKGFMVKAMMDPAKDQREWLSGLLDQTGITATELARRADLNPSTLTRFLQPDGRDGHVLSMRTVRKIEEVAGNIRIGRNAFRGGISEAEATPFDIGSNSLSPLKSAILAIKSGRNGVDAWQVETDILATLRIYRGDVLMVDLNATAQSGDIVCAQVYNWPASRADTVFRLYEPPFLLSGVITGDARKPLAVDGQNVIIRGVVIARLSSRDLLRDISAA
jgi:predicted transcriptional regulator